MRNFLVFKSVAMFSVRNWSYSRELEELELSLRKPCAAMCKKFKFLLPGSRIKSWRQQDPKTSVPQDLLTKNLFYFWKRFVLNFLFIEISFSQKLFIFRKICRWRGRNIFLILLFFGFLLFLFFTFVCQQKSAVFFLKFTPVSCFRREVDV